MTETTQLFVAEFLGTMFLILLGDGVVAGVLLKRSKSENAGWIVITTGWAIAVTAGIFVSMSFNGPGYINPVGPIADMTLGKLSTERGFACIGGEFAGAFIGAVIVWIHYWPHWSETSDEGLKLAVFCNSPAIRKFDANFISEFIGTFVLVFVAGAIASQKSISHPGLIGVLVWGIGLSLGGTTGYAINPARDLSPRLAHAVLPIPGKGPSDWEYSWIPVVGPICGGLAAAFLSTWLNGLMLK